VIKLSKNLTAEQHLVIMLLAYQS